MDDIIEAGKRLAHNDKCPLTYEKNGKNYGILCKEWRGIMHVLMDMALEPNEIEDVKGTLCYIIKNLSPVVIIPRELKKCCTE